MGDNSSRYPLGVLLFWMQCVEKYSTIVMTTIDNGNSGFSEAVTSTAGHGISATLFEEL